MGTLEVHNGGTLFIMDRDGDNRLQWNRNSVDEVDAARQRFDELKGRGYLAYKVTAGGGRGEVIDAFDPTQERIIMAPQMVGG